MSSRQIYDSGMGYFSSVDNIVKFPLMRPIEIPMNLAILSKQIFLNLPLKFFLIDKEILPAIHLPRPRKSRRNADTQLEQLWVFINQVFDECALADPGTAADDEGLVFWGRFLQRVGLEVLEDVVLDIFGVFGHAGVDDLAEDLLQVWVCFDIGCLFLAEDFAGGLLAGWRTSDRLMHDK